MFTNEREDVVYIYTTANESNAVYTRQEVWLMRSVCMIEDPSDNDGLNWVLYTGSCNHVNPTPRIFNITDQAQPSSETAKGYFFYFIRGSHVEVSMAPDGAGKAHFLMNTDAKKAAGMNKECGSENGKEIPMTAFETTGYYYICIIPTQSLTFRIDVNELYYDRPIMNECNNTEYRGSVKHKCCNFGFSDAFANLNCVYLTTRNQQPDTEHLYKPHQVNVYMMYNDAVKVLTVEIVVAMIAAASTLLTVAVYYACKARAAPRVQG